LLYNKRPFNKKLGEKMILAIIGSRDFFDYDLLALEASKFSPSKIISGGAAGADTLAALFAKNKNIELAEYLPDVENYGSPAAFHIRNREIAKNADTILACVSGSMSNGTKSTINAARKLGKKIIIIGLKHQG